MMRMLKDSCGGWLWRMVVEDGCGGWLWRMVVEDGCEGWWWVKVVEAGGGRRFGLAEGIKLQQWSIVVL
jgi:hypothetical protein